jgi:hypothetical protein
MVPGLLELATVAASLALTGSTGATELRITFWPQGRERGNAITRTLRCDPAGGTLAKPGDACRRLAAMQRPFAPVPGDMACTDIYGGPQEARVTGLFRGRRIWAGFRRTDGCEIDRWNRHAFLFPRGAGEP